MSRWVTRAAVLVAVLLAAAQLVRPERTSPATDPAHTLRAHVDAASELPAVVDRACGECHSNQTVWPWYTGVAPVSWLAVRGIAEARQAVNFSEWSSYSAPVQRNLLAASCDDATAGRMPGGAWTLLHPEARLSPRDVETICAAARQPELRPALVTR